MREVFFIYLGGGIVVSLGVAIWASRKNPRAFSPAELLLDPLGVMVGLLLWPLWVGISTVEILGVELLRKGSAPTVEEEPTEKPTLDSPGQLGISETSLKPSGKVKIGDRVVDAVTEGDFIPAGVAVVTIGRSMQNIVVKMKSEQSPGPE